MKLCKGVKIKRYICTIDLIKRAESIDDALALSSPDLCIRPIQNEPRCVTCKGEKEITFVVDSVKHRRVK